MIKWVAAIAALVAAVVYLLFQLGDTSPTPTKEASSASPSFESTKAAGPLPSVRSDDHSDNEEQDPETPPADEQADEQAKEEPASGLSDEEFNDRLDRQYPARYYASIAARCNTEGFDPDAGAHVKFRLQVLRGEVLATNVRIADSSLDDANFEQCLVAAIEQARWRDDDMPDLDEEHELFYRVRAQKKYDAESEGE